MVTAITSANLQVHIYTIHTGERMNQMRRVRNVLPTKSVKRAEAIVEDFRSAVQQAAGYIRTLHTLNNQSTATSPPNSPSSSTAPTVPSDADIMRSRVEAMNSLIDIMQRNLRVRYDINIPDVVQA